uniref:MgJr94P n=1 Tax=Conus magus TaxID=6492 RepID=Q3YED9_CONMA|nr:MgJr94P [Conus magus]
MKLTCVLIVVVLFLTACQLIPADYSRDTPGYPAWKLKTKMQNSRRWKLAKRCKGKGAGCDYSHECCSRQCTGRIFQTCN